MNTQPFPDDLKTARELNARLKLQVEEREKTIDRQLAAIEQKDIELSLQSKLNEEQAHSVLEVKAHHDKLEQENAELNLKIEKLLAQLYGRKSERRLDGAGQLFLDLGEEPTPEVLSAIDEAIRDAEQIVDDAEEEKKNRRGKRTRKSDRKFPEHLPRIEKIVDLPEEMRAGLKLIGYDEVETLRWIRPELQVILTKYAKYAHPSDKSQGIISPERPTGLVEGNRFDVSIGVDRCRSGGLEILLSPAVLSPTRHVRRQRLDAQSQHAGQH